MGIWLFRLVPLSFFHLRLRGLRFAPHNARLNASSYGGTGTSGASKPRRCASRHSCGGTLLDSWTHATFW